MHPFNRQLARYIVNNQPQPLTYICEQFSYDEVLEAVQEIRAFIPIEYKEAMACWADGSFRLHKARILWRRTADAYHARVESITFTDTEDYEFVVSEFPSSLLDINYDIVKNKTTRTHQFTKFIIGNVIFAWMKKNVPERATLAGFRDKSRWVFEESEEI